MLLWRLFVLLLRLLLPLWLFVCSGWYWCWCY
jgi:hypothetical protein